MIRKIHEKVNLFIAKSPRKAVLAGIMLFNLMFILIAATIIDIMSKHLSGLAPCNFWQSVYYTTTMVLDAGCISGMITDVGKTGVVAVLVCVVVVILGMVFFTGSVIGYVTNTISDFIESKNNGKNRLLISDHVVIINWNSRGAEIINEFLYVKKEVKVVVFVQDGKDEVDEEIRNRLDTTIIMENQHVYEEADGLPFFEKRKYLRKNLLRDKVTCIVREGDVAAARDLDNICISKAKTVIILDSDKDDSNEAKGNTQTVKTLIQVSDISKNNSDQVILVEVADEWTEDLVSRIISFKGEASNEIIIPVSYNWLLGKTYSQIAVMPELNDVYDSIFSTKGVHFISESVAGEYSRKNENIYIEKFLAANCRCVPLTVTETAKGKKAFFMACSRSDLGESREQFNASAGIKLKKEQRFGKRSIVLLGHNSNMDSLMEGFNSIIDDLKLRGENEAISILMVDDDESLKSHSYYKDYPYVETISADVYDEKIICERVLEFSKNAAEDATVLILSDDSVGEVDVDANALTYLIYIQEQIHLREKTDPDFDRDKLDLVVEILNPKNEDLVKSYGADRVIISNRYLSRVLSQISLGEAVFEIYAELFSDSRSEGISKEIMIKTATDMFEQIPEKCTAFELIRSVFQSGPEDDKSVLLGYIRNKRDYVFFGGDQRKITVELKSDDMLILFGNR